MSPVNSARSEKRSSVESQKAPKADCVPVMCATLPSMKSKMLATIMMTPASRNRSFASAIPASTLISTPMSVRTLGWMPSATDALMMAFSGSMQAAPIAPVTVTRWAGRVGIMRGSLTGIKRFMLPDGDSRSQGPDRPAA